MIPAPQGHMAQGTMALHKSIAARMIPAPQGTMAQEREYDDAKSLEHNYEGHRKSARI